MRIMGLLMILGLMSQGCGKATAGNGYDLSCQQADETHTRCINLEVICYESPHGISCVKR